MATHVLKCEEPHYSDLAHGAKTAELRRDDRGFERGDVLHLHQICDGVATGRTMTRVVTHILRGGPWLADGRTMTRVVTHILRGGPWLADGYVMLSLDRPPPPTALTGRQLMLMQLMTRHMDRTGRIPTLQAMAGTMGLAAKSQVARILDQLEQRGWITRLRGHSCGITILHRPATPGPQAGSAAQ
ncbi:DUF3850 domain-containing protein [Nitrospirillum sp. BR 11163]|uniref:DUF3850 domain-containing protein n=1 Tax=Nitrospirillum sp. BR 11163 TaxID=3104323 RepID=UPI002AFDDA7A|nr:DUF3850 domain-containing protein [Nitrospirillum sp. BR 11163]MEA1674067.1 DUF3850 domain-containing protein [Nitrospirillum sp. BR 11163]